MCTQNVLHVPCYVFVAWSLRILHQQVCHVHHLLCSSSHLFPCCYWSIILSLTISVLQSCSKLCTPITSPYRITIRNFHSVSACGAGRNSVESFPFPACDCIRKFGPCGGDQDVVLLICVSPFFHFSSTPSITSICTSQWHLSILDAIRNSTIRVCRQSR